MPRLQRDASRQFQCRHTATSICTDRHYTLICGCTHTHTLMWTHMPACAHTHTHTHTYIHTHAHAHARTHARTHAHTWKFLPLCTISMYLVEVACSAVFSEWVSESSLRRADLHRELQPVRAEVPTMLISSLCASTQEGKAFMLCHYNIKD